MSLRNRSDFKMLNTPE